jgi:type II secretory ATPase GspE/PulE/Tfp pilus assembly ATPase PilB-like protein
MVKTPNNSNKPVIIKAVNRILHQAIADEASALHCDFNRDDGLNIIVIQHGQAKEVANFSGIQARDMINYLAQLIKWTIGPIYESKTISLTTDLGKINLEAQGLATKNGTKIILNFKPKGNELIPLDSLGLNNEHFNLLKPAITFTGLVIITGPSGAGKTTTAHAILSALNANRANVYAVENYNQQTLPLINQLSRPKGLSWAMLFRNLEKQDADIIYLDLNGSLPEAHDLYLLSTRRLVIISLEANSIAECLSKLNLGVGANKINLIINQALIRQSCPKCGFSYQLDQPTYDELIKDFGMLDQDLIGLDLYHNTGCVACHHSGSLGHIGLFEMLIPSPDLKKLLVSGVSSKAELKIKEEVNLSLLEDGFVKALQGLVTVEELKKII